MPRYNEMKPQAEIVTWIVSKNVKSLFQSIAPCPTTMPHHSLSSDPSHKLYKISKKTREEGLSKVVMVVVC